MYVPCRLSPTSSRTHGWWIAAQPEAGRDTGSHMRGNPAMFHSMMRHCTMGTGDLHVVDVCTCCTSSYTTQKCSQQRLGLNHQLKSKPSGHLCSARPRAGLHGLHAGEKSEVRGWGSVALGYLQRNQLQTPCRVWGSCFLPLALSGYSSALCLPGQRHWCCH